MFGILALSFILIPAIEIYLLIEIGSSIGGLNTILIVIVTGIIGAALAKVQGLAVLYKIQTDLNSGKLPADQIIHGLLVFGGGLLLLTPGFLTDILGLSMVAPGSRHMIVSWTKHLFKKGIENGNIHFSSFGKGSSQGFQSYTFHSSSEDIKDPFEQMNQQDSQIIDEDNVIEAEFSEKKDNND